MTVFYAAQIAEEKKAIDTEILDVRQLTDLADYIMVTSGDNPAQLKAIAEHIEDSLSLQDIEPEHTEGKYGDKWLLLDYGDFVVHIIDLKTREFYDLEELWNKAFFIPRDEWFNKVKT